MTATRNTYHVGSWLRAITSPPQPALRLVVCAHAGGAASYFRHWGDLVPPGTELLATCYPGREERYAEPPATDLEELADPIADACAALTGVPLVLFGHSMGAMVAYETALRLQALGTAPAVLGVSGAGAPGHTTATNHAAASDAELIDHFTQLGGTNPELFQHRDLLDLLLRVVRADYKATEDYGRARSAGPAAVPLDVPVAGYFGDSDPEVDAGATMAWSGLTRAGFHRRMLPGGHFFLNEHAREVLADLIGRLPRE